MGIKVLFFTQTPEVGAAPRYRVYQYLDYLRSKGFECDINFGASNDCFRKLVERNKLRDKFRYYYSEPFISRLKSLFTVKKYDIIFIQRDLLLYFPHVFEVLIQKLNKKIVFDYDDALFEIPNSMDFRYLYYLRGKNKTANVIKLSRHVIAGNKYLADYALKYNQNVTIIPTSVDLSRHKDKTVDKKTSEKIVIGWIGRPGSAFYLKKMQNVFLALARKHNFILKVVGAKELNLPGVSLVTKNWRLEEEIEDLGGFDIGIMPLTEDAWAQGKSATKLLEYLAAGIPVVCSPVGINKDIISEGENGFLAGAEQEWIDKLSILLSNEDMRKKFSRQGRFIVEKFFSIQANAPKLEEVLMRVYRGKKS
jgi:glycosyltransferase involved in cell wall biosynthesis